MTSHPVDLPPLREVIAKHGLAARKSLGQHFLLDGNLTGRIARGADDLAVGSVIEVGPGPGGLTRALLGAGAGQVIAVEKDQRCLSALQPLVAAFPDRLTLLEDDAMAVDFTSLGGQPRRIVANLPYNISTALLVKWLANLADDSTIFDELVLMFQKEVAGRLQAAPGSRSYGRLSVITQWLCEVRTLFTIPARAFTPPPKVDSAVVHLKPRVCPLAQARFATLEKVTAAGFGQRRKMLRRSLKSLGADTADLLEQTRIGEELRAEDLTVEQFCALARALDSAR